MKVHVEGYGEPQIGVPRYKMINLDRSVLGGTS